MKAPKKHSRFFIFVFSFLILYSFLAVVSVLTNYSSALAQTIPQHPNKTNAEGKREGTWTIFYDKIWQVITNADSAVFYRLITYENGKPKGMVRDYYRSGQVEMEAYLISDNPQIHDSISTWYDEKGKIGSMAYYQNGEMSIENTEKLLDSLKRNHSINLESREYALVLNHLARRYDEKGDYTQAGVLLSEAVRIFEKAIGKDDYDYAFLLADFAINHSKNGKYPQAEALFLESLKILEKIVGKEHRDYAYILGWLEYVYRQQGKYTQTEPFILIRLKILEKTVGKEHRDYVNALMQLAGIYTIQNKYTQAETLYLESLKILEKTVGKEHHNYSNALKSLSLLYETQGKYAQAEVLYLEGLKILEKTVGKENGDYAINSSFLANLYLIQGKYTQVEPLFLENLKFCEKNLYQNSISNYGSFSFILNNLIKFYEYQGKYALVESLLLKNLELIKKESKDDISHASALNGLAELYRKQGKYTQAEPLFLESLQIYEKTTSIDKTTSKFMMTFFDNSMANLASLYKSQGKYEKAESLLLESLKILETLIGKGHKNYSINVNNLAELYLIQGKYAQAEPLFLASVQSRMKQLENQMSYLSEQEEVLYYETLKDGFATFHSFVAEEVSKANRKHLLGELYNLQLASKALLLNSSAKWKQNIMNSKDNRLIEKYFTWIELKKQITSLESKGRNAQLDSLEKETEVQEKQLSKLAERFNKISDKKLRTWQEVKASLKQGQAAVEVIRIQKFGIKKTVVDSSDQRLPVYQIKGQTDTIQYLALIVTPQTQNYPDMVFLTNGNELEKQIKFYSNAVKYRAKDKNSYGLYWGKLGAWFKQRNIKKVYFSPDGVYHQINLNTLQNPATQQYLIDEIDVQIVTNTKDLLTKPTEEFTNQYAVLVGNPDFSTLRFNQKTEATPTEEVKASAVNDTLQVLTNRSLNWGSVAPLPNTQVEIDLISKALKTQNYEVEVFSGKQATEENIKSTFKPKILHIATHGFFELAKEGDEKGKSNPLTRSGLVLARKDTLLQSENGILTAYESTIMNLEGTELVVLSACETGLGEVMNGEGVYGLQRAFKVAGAKSILMSLWKVDDKTTQELMTLFYEYWLAGNSKQAAFKMAQMKLREKYKSPYYWGCFVMVGE